MLEKNDGALYPWQTKEKEQLEKAGKDSAYLLIFVCISMAAGLVFAGVMKIVNVLKNL